MKILVKRNTYSIYRFQSFVKHTFSKIWTKKKKLITKYILSFIWRLRKLACFSKPNWIGFFFWPKVGSTRVLCLCRRGISNIHFSIVLVTKQMRMRARVVHALQSTCNFRFFCLTGFPKFFCFLHFLISTNSKFN